MLKFNTISILAIAALLDFLWLDYFFNIPWWLYLLVPIVWAVLTIIGSFHIRWNFHLDSLHSNKSTPNNQVAITFDDGPHPEFTPKVLQLLERNNAKATFFCIGRHIEKHPEIFKKIVALGHTVGNHTFSHTNNFGFLNTQQVIEELQQTNHTAEKIINQKMNLYRPAFGVTNPNIKSAVKNLNILPIGWSIRSLDTTKRSEKKVLERITKKIKKGDIILMHDTSEKTVNVLEQLLIFLKTKNLQSVTVDQLLNINAYA